MDNPETERTGRFLCGAVTFRVSRANLFRVNIHRVAIETFLTIVDNVALRAQSRCPANGRPGTLLRREITPFQMERSLPLSLCYGG